ncbi:MAG TPA: glycosyltransferase family 2 protein [Cytophagaceae bacterium]|jgi:glycosyltransferase involved in cell wall biosynthesis|nr:glycosyltransferase family 2 protein [Cytophagaceae bacterium]
MGLLEILPKVEEKTGWPWTEETDVSVYDVNSKFPKITIVTPSYNQGQFIEETIRSILLQNYPNLEYIIIDGGSTDNTVEVVKKYEPWITYWVSEKDSGQSHAINKGFERATGEIVNWINSDDSLRLNALQVVANALKEENIYCVCGNANLDFIPPDKPTLLFRTSLLDADINTHLANCSFSQPATFFKISAYKQITPLEETLHMNMDMFLWYKFICLFSLNSVKATDEILCDVKCHPDAKTIKQFEKSETDKGRIYHSLFKSLNPEFRSRLNVFPLAISDEVRSKIDYLKLRMWYFRTHLYKVEFDGSKKGIKLNNLFNYIYLHARLFVSKR